MVVMKMHPPGMGPPLPAHSFSIVRTGGIRPGTISSVSMRETNNHSFRIQSQMFRTSLYLALVDLAQAYLPPLALGSVIKIVTEMDGPKYHEILEEFMAMVSMFYVHMDKHLHDYDQHLGGGLMRS